MGDLTSVCFASASDAGCARPRNEDVSLADGNARIALVADGLGGHSRGEVASAAAAAAVVRALRAADRDRPEESLLGAVLEAHAAVRAAAAAEPAAANMGATLVVAWWPRTAEELWYAHVGDSRAYLCRQDQLRGLTVDHNLASQAGPPEAGAAVEPPTLWAKALTQAIGSSRVLSPDIGREPTIVGDRVLLCSDGLTDMVPDAEIAAILLAASTPEDGCARLVRAALDGGGADNVTVVIADVVGTGA